MRTVRIVLASTGALAGIAGVALASWRVIAVSLVLLAGSIALEVRDRLARTKPLAGAGSGALDRVVQAQGAPVPRPAGAEKAADNEEVAPALHVRGAPPPTTEPSELVAALFEAVADVSGDAVAAHLWFEDAATSTLRQVSAAGRCAPGERPVPLEGSDLGRALLTGRAVWGPAVGEVCPGTASPIHRYAVPLFTPVARGVVAVDLATESVNHEALTWLMARFRAPLTGAFAMHLARQETDAARAVLDACAGLVHLTDEEAIARALLGAAVDVCGADTGSIMLLGDQGRLSVRAVVGLPEKVLESPPVAPGEGIAGWVLAMGHPLLIEDLDGEGPRGRRHGVRSALCVPIADEDGSIGVINIGYRSFISRPTATVRRTLQILARVGARTFRSARALASSRDLCFDALTALALALETKDPYAHGGTERVLDLSVRLGRELGLTDQELSALRVAALLHDVGMTAAGATVGAQDRPLSTVEWGLVKAHPAIAADILRHVPALRDAVPIVYHHHERYDGSGYVVGLSGESIPLGARILAVADAFVAMTSDRPYRSAMSQDEALDQVRAGAGAQFDPAVVAALQRVLREREQARSRE